MSSYLAPILETDPENSERGGRVPQLPPPLRPAPERKLHFSGHAAYSIVGVFVMQSKVTLTFRKTELKSILSNDFQSKIIVLVEEKKGGGEAPSAPPLNPRL